MAVKEAIIFSIGTIGAAATKAKFLAVAAGVALLGAKVISAIKDMEKFTQVHQRLQIDIVAADQATKGLVDTMNLMTTANKLSALGLDVTAKQFETMQKWVVNYSKATGESVEATNNFLVQALASGRVTTLKKFGLELKGGGDKADVFNEAIEQLGESLGDTEIEIENLSEAFFALENNFDTALGLTWEYIEAGGSLQSVVEKVSSVFGDLNLELEAGIELSRQLGPEFATLTETVFGMAESFAIAALELFGFDETARQVADRSEKRLRNMREEFRSEQKLKKMRDLVEQVKSGAIDAAEALEIGRQIAAGNVSLALPKRDKKPPGDKDKDKRPPGGKGRRKKRAEVPTFEMEFAPEDVIDIMEGLMREGAAVAPERMDFTIGAGEPIGEFAGTQAAEQLFLAEAGLGPPTEEMIERQEQQIEINEALMEQEREKMMLREEHLLQLERNIDFAGQFGAAWMSAFSGVTSGGLAAGAAFGALQGSINMMTMAAITGQKSFGKSMLLMLRDAAGGLSAQSTLLGIMELVKAAVSAARFDPISATAHLSAAGFAFAQAVIMLGLGRALHKAGSRGGGRGKAANIGGGGGAGFGATGGGAGAPGGGEGEKRIVIDMKVDLDGEQIHRSVRENDEQAGRDGRRRVGE